MNLAAARACLGGARAPSLIFKKECPHPVGCMTYTYGRARSVRSSRHVTRQFATTQWKVVLEARDGTESQAHMALETLCHAYWFPLYAYVRSRGHAADEARDLTQAFFADLLGRNFLEAIDRSKGRFRSFLLASLEHFLSHERDKANALKKGGGAQPMSLDAGRRRNPLSARAGRPETPEMVFERRWGLTVMERTMERLRAESRRSARPFRAAEAVPDRRQSRSLSRDRRNARHDRDRRQGRRPSASPAIRPPVTGRNR